MTDIKQTLTTACTQLKTIHDTWRLDAEILLCHVLQKNRVFLFSHQEFKLSSSQLKQFNQLIQLRLQGHPIAHLIGEKEFWSLNLRVSPATLIPRPETELLVEIILKAITDSDAQLLDLGTGSGAIALALASERPSWHIDACDTSLDALNIAKFNAETNNIKNVSFHHSNWFEQLPTKLYQAIVTNPPYITASDPHLSQGDVRFEPQTALISANDGLQDIETIIQQNPTFLAPNGLLAIEHGYQQQDKIIKLLQQAGFTAITAHTDLNHQPRAVTAKQTA